MRKWFFSGQTIVNAVGLSISLVLVDHPRLGSMSYTTRTTSVSIV